jgi:hypothetical protein
MKSMAFRLKMGHEIISENENNTSEIPQALKLIFKF